MPRGAFTASLPFSHFQELFQQFLPSFRRQHRQYLPSHFASHRQGFLVVVDALEPSPYRDYFTVGHHGIAIQVLAKLADEAACVALDTLLRTPIEIDDFGAAVIMLTVAKLEQEIDYKRGDATLLAADGCMSSRFHFFISLYVRRSICSK